MQSLDIISVNLWQIIISLVNLLIIFLILKRFLYKPVKKMMDARRADIDLQLSEAEEARAKALSDKAAYEEKLLSAEEEADKMIKNAADIAIAREERILADARAKAEGIVKAAEADALLEKKKAREDIKREIVDVSTVLTGKLLEREISEADHKKLIDSVIDEIGAE